MKEHIDYSNSRAAENRNSYPVQEQATQMEIWEYVPCSCDESCTCRKLGCTHHWKLKPGIRFEEFRDGFLRMFVDWHHHLPVIDALAGKGSEGLTTRAIGAYHVLNRLRLVWPEISSQASAHNKSLFCDDWMPASFRNRLAFAIEGTSIYQAKQFSILFPDICVPYDTASRVKMITHLDSSGAGYAEFLARVRDTFLASMRENIITMPQLRRLDAPQEQLPYDPSLISLPRQGMDYGTTYTPAERPLGIVIDKCYYQPKAGAESPFRGHRGSTKRNEIPAWDYTIHPLSGKGQPISVHYDPPSRLVLWGDLMFELSNEIIRTILETFFKESRHWYLLGASMTDPDPAGLGAFVRSTFPSFTPRHASAIAAIMVHEGFVTFRGRKPIELKKVAGKEETERLMREEDDA